MNVEIGTEKEYINGIFLAVPVLPLSFKSQSDLSDQNYTEFKCILYNTISVTFFKDVKILKD
jgi:hypothetical protein